MLRSTLSAAALALALAASGGAHAFEATVERDGTTLTFVDAGDALPRATDEAIIETFFAAYARQRADFNPGAASAVTITVDPAYDGIAYVDGAVMTINPGWLERHPGDTDLVTHEAMHIVQAYGDGDAPGWLTEGIADWARDAYGRDNAAAGWALPETVTPEHRHDSGYRVTAAFLKWAEQRHAGLVKGLDAALREGRYDDATWSALAGEDVATLWNRYAAERSANRIISD
ncbi:basic secretory protein-like protein [Coralloluteibacterium stylophorae]|uniref:Basic Secretory protein n=1 Tax=Coralloluteibacterium stylophorae TaxID=1776034 RepID=A0A8J7VT66_9GAMM|nr:basic secretory protein-like protein [Coralloluteibacterium stylophorae]MBS7455797.1 Basic Secretory protein [Coralloluteibacterium stylophorae]